MDYNHNIIIHTDGDSVDAIYDSIVFVQNNEIVEGEVADSNCSSVDETPNGTRFWIPDVDEELIPVVTSVWSTPEDAFVMYEKYAAKAGFDVRRGGEKKVYNGSITHKYFLCHRAGKPKKKNAADTLVNVGKDTSRLHRNSNFKVTNCLARIKLKKIKGSDGYQLYGFEESHNHPLFDDSSRHLSRARRQLTFDEKLFIQNVSTNNIGATKAHRLRACLKGGYENVRGTVVDYKNFKGKMNLFIGDRDAQMVVDKFRNRKVCLPEFSFDIKCENNELLALFWADETSKCNYREFGDVIAFDATYKTNKYSMLFVPFTGVDNHNRCVTFGAGLLSNEKMETYKWLLDAFLRCHDNKQPTLALTDQAPELTEAVKRSFNESHHRLCMWHIMKKLPTKMCTETLNNTDFRARLHKLVWNVYIDADQFEQRWRVLIEEFNLQNNEWLSSMFAIRESWIPAYFNHFPMSCLMKTTSRSECSNAFFKIFSHKSNTLVQFMLCFETAMEKQRHAQRVLNDHTSTTIARLLTPLAIELFASQVYTRTIFFKVQIEIYKGVWACSHELVKYDEDMELFRVKHSDIPSKNHYGFKVTLNKHDGAIVCSCNLFGRRGYLCRHIFSVMKSKNMDVIPEHYILRRWRRDVLPPHLTDPCHRYVNKHCASTQVGADAISNIELCLDKLRNHPVMFAAFVDKINKVTESTLSAIPSINPAMNDEQVFMDLLGVTVPDHIEMFAPHDVCTKGSGKHTSKRLIGHVEKHSKKRKRQMRECQYCHIVQDKHDQRTCDLKKKHQLEARAAAQARDANTCSTSNTQTA